MVIRKTVMMCLVIIMLTGINIPSAIAEESNKMVNESLKERQAESEELVEEENQTPNDSENDTETTPFQDENEDMVGLSNQNIFFSLLKLIGAFAFVIFLIYFGLRFINKKTQVYRSNHYMQNIGGVPLGSNRSIQLVRIGDRLFIVGVGDSIQLLKEIENEDEVEQILKQHESQLENGVDQTVQTGFGWLKKKLQKGNEENLNNDKTSDRNQFKQLLNNQLTQITSSQNELHEKVKERNNK
ncbi:flagellar biosynthetic protein FliO [Alkalihalobacillus trypoxylicola]|uniref:Flagellar protein n=1 Tax=Alkalihalobacillus trypoxylicola TaxID=519424 RepID=A0A161PL37_9BACI|nr:flagellar biosynthetic protein FliO [Alkalihalobacillus trypoxylicola]KYG35046.1 hypothetical protein AZF04_01545 [Alkalihalobacillus trypoxylicola]